MKKLMKVIDEENNEGEFEIFLTFDLELTNKSYVMYYNKRENENGAVLMHMASYVQEDDYLRVDTRLTRKEAKMMDTIIKTIIDEAKKMENEEK